MQPSIYLGIGSPVIKFPAKRIEEGWGTGEGIQKFGQNKPQEQSKENPIQQMICETQNMTGLTIFLTHSI